MVRRTLTVTSCPAALGAIISGVDLSQPLSDTEFATTRRGLPRPWRDLLPPPVDHARAAPGRCAAFGAGRHPPLRQAGDGCPQIAELFEAADQTTHIGGDPHFAAMARVYAALSRGLRKTLDGLQAVHSIAQRFGAQGVHAKAADLGGRIGNTQAVTPDVAHLGVIRRPDTGRRTPYGNAACATHLEGGIAVASAPLPNLLYEHASKPEFSFRFAWQEGAGLLRHPRHLAQHAQRPARPLPAAAPQHRAGLSDPGDAARAGSTPTAGRRRGTARRSRLRRAVHP